MNSRLQQLAANSAKAQQRRNFSQRNLRMETAPSESPRPTPSARAQNPSGFGERRAQTWMAMFTLIFFGCTAAYWQFYGSPLSMFEQAAVPEASNTIMRIINDRSINRRLVIGGVQLGMTPEMVKDMYPAAHYLKDRHGQPAMSISTPTGSMVLWLYDDSRYVRINGDVVFQKRERVFRMRMDEAFARLDEEDLMDLYGRFYGRPIEATCDRSQLGDTPRCTYRWWGGDGIELTAILKQKIDTNGKPYTLLTTIATNTQQAAQQASTSRKADPAQSPS